jgi:hypothetical protein
MLGALTREKLRQEVCVAEQRRFHLRSLLIVVLAAVLWIAAGAQETDAELERFSTASTIF